MKPLEGIETRLYAKCLALRSGDKTVIYLGLDAIGSSGFLT